MCVGAEHVSNPSPILDGTEKLLGLCIGLCAHEKKIVSVQETVMPVGFCAVNVP